MNNKEGIKEEPVDNNRDKKTFIIRGENREWIK